MVQTNDVSGSIIGGTDRGENVGGIKWDIVNAWNTG